MTLLPNKANSEGNNQSLDDRTPIPAGDYIAHVVKTEFKQTKKKNGHYLSVHFKVLEGEFTGRMVFVNLNLDNPNPIAVEIANKEMNSMCQAMGLEDVEDSDELLQQPLMLSVAIDPATDDFAASNKINKYSSAGESGGSESAPDFVDTVVKDTPVTGAKQTPESENPAAGVEEDSGKLPWEK